MRAVLPSTFLTLWAAYIDFRGTVFVLRFTELILNGLQSVLITVGKPGRILSHGRAGS